MSVKYGVVLGCPRSGTSFLMRVLNSLANSECKTGNLFPIAIPHIVNQPLSLSVYDALSRAFEYSLQDYLCSGIPYSRINGINRWLKGYIDFQELLQILQRNHKIERIIYKEPFLSFAPEFTYNALPNCRIIHIYRDGRDCADSLVRCYDVLTDEKLTKLNSSEVPLGRKYDHRYIPWWVETGKESEFLAYTPYVRAIWMWKEMVNRCHQFFSSPDIKANGRVLLLKYEDLISNPKKYGKIIIEHLEASTNKQIEAQLKQARASSIGIHKKRNHQEIEQAETIAGKELKIYGYL